MTEPAPCDPEIFAKGTSVCAFHSSTKVTEPWVQKVAKLSGQRVDWHFSGGMAHVLFLGDYDKVVAAINELKPELDAAHVADYEARNPSFAKDYPSTGAGCFYIIPPNAKGLYRAILTDSEAP